MSDVMLELELRTSCCARWRVWTGLVAAPEFVSLPLGETKKLFPIPPASPPALALPELTPLALPELPEPLEDVVPLPPAPPKLPEPLPAGPPELVLPELSPVEPLDPLPPLEEAVTPELTPEAGPLAEEPLGSPAHAPIKKHAAAPQAKR
jgi:hypothetical protein